MSLSGSASVAPSVRSTSDDEFHALCELGRLLKAADYVFTTVTPETCRRNHARNPGALAADLRGVFGWSLPFEAAAVPRRVLELLQRAQAVDQVDGYWISRVRYSTMSGHIFVHSAYPTVQTDAVFFGPDSHRFSAFVGREIGMLPLQPASRIIDVGCGSGVGGILASRLAVDASLVLSDINVRALRYSRINAALAGAQRAEVAESNLFENVGGRFDLIISNPPYMADPQARAYRDGGGKQGAALSLRILQEALARLAPTGRLLLYTGSAVVAGLDVFLENARPILTKAGVRFRYVELDPDVFGEELEQPGYTNVERIAAVALVACAPTMDHME